MKKGIAIVLALVMALGLMGVAAAEGEKTAVRVGSLKGPTTMGLVKLMQDDKNGTSLNDYEFTMAGAADEISGKLGKGDLDMALIPANLASVLYNKTEGKIQMTAINTLGVLYVVEAGDSIQSIADLKGKTVLSTGKGTTPEYGLNFVLSKNGLDPAKDLTIEFKSEATELAAALADGSASIAVLPQPFVTTAMAKNDKLRVALSLTDEWSKAAEDSAMITGVAVVNAEFARQNPEAVKNFLSEYQASTEYVNANPKEASAWIEEAGIAPAAVAEKAIPACNIVCITGEEMQKKAQGYLNALYEQNPKAVGGKLPDEAFYFVEK
jgi:NitT/TauT family transport system substrate-binding protein